MTEPNTEQSAAVYVSEGFCPLTGKPINPSFCDGCGHRQEQTR